MSGHMLTMWRCVDDDDDDCGGDDDDTSVLVYHDKILALHF
jgi:hypothetical protein